MEKVTEVKQGESRKQVGMRTTSDQWGAFEKALIASGMSHVEFVRYAFTLACEQYGVEFPQNMPKVGKYERNKVSTP